MKKLNHLNILLVEDEPGLRQEMAAFLELYSAVVTMAANGREALEMFSRKPVDLVISDIRMPILDGLGLAEKLKESSPETPVILCTAFTETHYLLKAIELSVAGLVRKPLDMDELLTKIHTATAHIVQRREIESLSSELTASINAQLGGGSAMEAISEQAARAARTPFNLLLQGETGSGKSFLSRIIHQISTRHSGPFIPIQLAALPEQLAASELFGHTRGAFTGAIKSRIGLVEVAEGGTIFLDDVETCPPLIQTKLLRLVEEKRFTPLGSTTEKTGDVRIISASNHDLLQEVRMGRFREDLYYRLADVVIAMPSLRANRESIIPLTTRILEDTCGIMGRNVPILDTSAQSRLIENPWPGNIRQLKSVIRRVLIDAGDIITAQEISETFRAGERREGSNVPPAPLSMDSPPPPFPCSMNALEKWSLEQALHYCGGKRMKTASMLGMNYYTFMRRLRKHGLAMGGARDEKDERAICTGKGLDSDSR